MIQNLVVNGCSFTSLNRDYKSWSEYVADELNVTTYKNLGMGGAGNHYIAQGTIDYLEHADLDPAETLVLVMWSGPSRKDKLVTEHWWNHIKNNNYPFGAQFVSENYPNEEHNYWVFSGGAANSWNYNPVVKELFEIDYKTTDATIMCKESLVHFKRLTDYFSENKYHYKFTSFLNYWKPSFVVDYGEYGLDHHCKHIPLYQKFDFSNWFFTDNDKNTFGEFATSINEIDGTNHPTGIAHEQFATKFVIPSLKEILE